MTYDDGSEIMIGDRVMIERGQTAGTVEHIIESDAECRSWGVVEQGVMLLSRPFGRVFWTVDAMKRDPMKFEARGNHPTA